MCEPILIVNHNQYILLHSRIHNHTSIIVTLRIPTKLCRAKKKSLTSIMVHMSFGVALWGTETQIHYRRQVCFVLDVLRKTSVRWCDINVFRLTGKPAADGQRWSCCLSLSEEWIRGFVLSFHPTWVNIYTRSFPRNFICWKIPNP